MKNVLLAAVAALSLTACTDRYGRPDYARGALLGAGIGAAGGLLGTALNDQGGSRHYPSYRQPYRPLGNGYGGYGPVPYGYRGW